MLETNGKFGGIFEEARPVSGVILHKVNVGLGELLDQMARFEVQEMKRVTRYQQNVDIPSQDTLARYIRTLIWVRVTQCNDPRGLKDYKTLTYSVRVPARLSLMLDNLGEAFDYDSNIRFVPVCEIESSDLMSVDECIDISHLIESFLVEGYHSVGGIKKDKYGSVELMSKLVLSDPEAMDKVLSYRKDNPVYAFFAAVFKLQVLSMTYQEAVIINRVQYSNTEMYRHKYPEYYRDLAKETDRAESDGSSLS